MRGLGEIERLSRCAEPDLAVITNIGTAHIGRLGSREAIAQAKCEITAQLHPDGAVVIPAGDPLLEAALARVWPGRVVRIALADEAGSANADLLGDFLDADSSLQLGQLSLALPLPGRHNARNLLLALAVAELLGVPPELLTALQVDVPDGRNQRRQIAGITVLDETYNASPEAVLAALELLNSQPGRRFAVLGKMLELGDQSLELHRQVGSRAAELGLDGLVVVAEGPEGEAMLAAAADLPRLVRVASPEQAAPPLGQWLQPGDCLLLKASRGVALERLLPLLEQQFAAVD
jgi:UDP-N-acetylmuramoyl-tripeptide--D-alanyl-D-alanine ligase